MDIINCYRQVFASLFAGICISLIVYISLSKWESTKSEAAFLSSAQTISHAIKREIHDYSESLYSLANFVEYSSNLNKKTFKRFTLGILSRHPSIQAFTWSPIMSHTQRLEYEQRMQSFEEGFSVKYISKQNGLIRDIERNYYHPVTLIEPRENNEVVLGFNVSSSEIRKKAIDTAFSSRSLAASERINLIQNKVKTSGILLMHPIYENNEKLNSMVNRSTVQKGILVGVLNMNKLLISILAQIPKTSFQILLIDKNASIENSLINADARFSNQDYLRLEELLPKSKVLFLREDFTFADRTWQIMIIPPEQPSSLLAWFSYVIILFVTALASYYLMMNRLSLIEIKWLSMLQSSSYVQLKREVIERKRAEKKLNKFAHAINTSADGISFISDEGYFTYSNEAALEMYGYNDADVAKLHYLDKSFHLEQPFNENELFTEIQKSGFWSDEITQCRKDGTKFPAQITLTFIRNEKGEKIGLQAVTRDLTEKNMLEAQLRQGKKMEALGTLAGGIAHDFNNILAAIMANTEMMLLNKLVEVHDEKRLNSILDTSQRAANLVKQIMTFSRMETVKFRSINLTEVVSDALNIVRATLPANIKIETDLTDNCCKVMADTTQIHQIILNLCTNAYHAMQNTGGTITVAVTALNQATYELNDIVKKQIQLTITDTGKGISLDVQDKMFDPFFTTKNVGEGTGLGLAVVNGIVENHFASIKVDSEIDVGTCFTLVFPACEKIAQDEKTKIIIEAQESLAIQNKHILIVEDESQIAMLYQEFLQDIGYTTTICEDGGEALAVYQNKNNHFDLVITDQAMPNITGKELCIELLELSPELPIILLTGFSDVISEDEAQEIGIRHYLMKPLSLLTLKATIEKCFTAS